jgi:hypothetical protein
LKNAKVRPDAAAMATYGIPHSEYVSGMLGDTNAIFAVKPVSHETRKLIDHMSKFEHPIPALAGPPGDPTAAFPNWGAVEKIITRAKKSGQKANATRVVVCVPLQALTEGDAAKIVERLDDDLNVIAMHALVASISEYVATVVFVLFLSEPSE